MKDDTARIAPLERQFSQVSDTEFLRLNVNFDTWDGIVSLLQLFRSVSSVRRLRLCFISWSPFPKASGNRTFSAIAKRLDPILASSEDSDSAFHTLSAAEFAFYFPDHEYDDTLREQHPLLCAWVQRTLPQLHERRIVTVYACKCVLALVDILDRESYC